MKQQWTEEELEEFWRLYPEELKLLQNKSGETRLSFIFMLKYFKIFGYFPNEREIMSPLVIAYLSRQVDVEVAIFNTCHFTSRIGIIHRQQIREFLGFRPPQKSDAKLFINWLIEKVLPEGRDSLSFINGKSYEYFRKTKIEPFSPKKMERYIFSALNTFEISLFANILRSLTKENKKSLLDLLATQENQSLESFYLVDLKQDAGNVSLEEIKRIKCIQEVGLPAFPFNGITPRLLEKYKTRVMSERPSEIRDHKEPMKYATLAIFCYVRGQEILDNLVDLLIQVIHKIGKRSENKVNKKLITELKKVGGKQAILVDLAKVIVDNPDGVIKEVVYPVVKAETLQEIIKESQLTKGYKEQVYTLMRASYGSHYRRMLAPILETISFQSNNAIHHWVSGSNKYRNPDEDLPADFDENRDEHYSTLNKPKEAKEFTSKLQQEMRDALSMFNNGLPKNKKVKILVKKKKGGHISLFPLDEQAVPPNLEAIKKQVLERWPTIGLLDILKETNFRTGFTSVFSSTASREYLDPDQLTKRLLLCVFSYGTNTGLKRISASNPEITFEELRHIRRRYLTKANLRAAITEVVNAILREREEKIFGGATTSVASDSKKFGVWDQNLLTEWHVRNGGRGVVIYWHIDKKSVLIFSQLKSCSSSEVSSMIEGVLRHCTDMEIQKGYVDSHGQSIIGFAFSYMLGFDLLPRIKAIHKEKLYRPNSGKPDDYPNLQNILTRPIRWDLIEEQYDQIVKFTTTLRLGTADAESILRRFTSNNAQHPVYQALMELGKAVKTIFLCRYLHCEELRREIHEGLNVVESSNSVNDFIFYGKAGEISTNRREDQELAMLCLHLLQNSLVCINTLLLQSVLSRPQWEDKLAKEDKRAITALFYEHINPYGLLVIDLNQRIPIDKLEVANDQRIANAA